MFAVHTEVTPQARKVLDLINRDGHITRLTAMHYGIANLTARIAELRRAGFEIACEERLDAEGRSYGRWYDSALATA